MDIMTALTALSSSINLGKTALAARDQKLIDETVTEMTQKLMEVMLSAATLLQEKNAAVDEAYTFRDKYRKLEATLSDLSEYEPYVTRGGAICLRPKEGMKEAKLSVHVCANCAATGKKTYLQPEGGDYYLNCPNGHGNIASDKTEPDEPGRAYTDNGPRNGY